MKDFKITKAEQKNEVKNEECEHNLRNTIKKETCMMEFSEGKEIEEGTESQSEELISETSQI